MVTIAICQYCDESIALVRVRTGKQFFGPFWRDGWVHNGGDTRCWTPFGSPKSGTEEELHDD